MLSVTIDLRNISRAEEAFRRFPERLQKRLKQAMQKSEADLAKELKDRVPVRTGNLRRSWNVKPVEAQPSGLGWIGGMGSNASYAAYMEFGFHGSQSVKAHTRHTAFGRETRPFTVPAHTRNVNFAGKPYARPGLAAALPKIVSNHQQAIAETVKESGL